LNGVTVTD